MMDEALQLYITESREQLEEVEEGLLRLEHEDDPHETINAIFRAMHTIKGSAGLFALDQIVSFTHVVESTMVRLRDGRMTVTSNLVALLLACRDHVCLLIDSVEKQTSVDAETVSEGQRLMSALNVQMGEPSSAIGTGAPATVPNVVSEPKVGDEVAADHWHISLRFGPEVLRNGMDPISFLSYLQLKGEIRHVSPIVDAIPPLAEMDPEVCYLGLEIAYATNLDKKGIEDVFEFIAKSSRINILPPRSRITEYVRLIESLPPDPQRLGDILVQCGSLTQQELENALTRQSDAVKPGADNKVTPPLGQVLVDQGSVHPAVVEAALVKQRQNAESKNVDSKTVRVDAKKLDQLINLVGELVIAGASANLAAQKAGVDTVVSALASLHRLVGEVRDGTLSLRMVQIGGTFNRFQRVVRDVSHELGKEIDLVITGADTELDKTVVERISDPLMHLVRNAMDHGIESPEVRVQQGKPARGTLRLNAFHDSGNIVIEVGDDGAGLNRERILKKAIEKGLVQEGQAMNDDEVYRLIFEPGFSTADKVSNLSGRGVGMDVVKRNIDALRGTVEIASELGKGSTMRIRLPLTLAIIDGFHVSVSGASFVVLLDLVEECIKFNKADINGDRDFINLRGEVLPLVRLHEQFNLPGTPSRRQNVLIVNYANQRVGFVVDELLGEFQTVIKPLGPMFGEVRGVGGSTILATGEVALILDIAALVQLATQRELESVAEGNSDEKHVA